MLSALMDLVIEALVQAFGWIVRVVRSVFMSTAADGGLSAAEEVAGQGGRRRARRQLKQLSAAGDIDELVRVYNRCGGGDRHRSLRIEALLEIARVDASAAEPLLREVIAGPDDPWVVLAALDIAARHKMTGLSEMVIHAKDDPRPVIATAATSVHKRLEAHSTGR